MDFFLQLYAKAEVYATLIEKQVDPQGFKEQGNNLCCVFTAKSTQWGHVERGQFI